MIAWSVGICTTYWVVKYIHDCWEDKVIKEKKKELAETAYDKALYESGMHAQRLRDLDNRAIEVRVVR